MSQQSLLLYTYISLCFTKAENQNYIMQKGIHCGSSDKKGLPYLRQFIIQRSDKFAKEINILELYQGLV